MWLILALMFSMASAVFSGINRSYKLEGFRLNFYRMAWSFLLLSPLILLLEWPKPSFFYAAAMLHGMAMVIGSAVVLNMASRHNGRIATMFIPVQIFVAFMLWLAVSPDMWAQYLLQPANLIYIALPFALMTYCLFNMRKVDASFALFLQIAPIGVMYAFADLFAKLTMGDTGIMTTFIYLYVVFGTGLLCATPFLFIPTLRIKPEEPLLMPNMLRAGFLLALAGMAGFGFFLFALRLSPNPAYVTAIGTMTPVWIMLYHKYHGIPDEGDTRTALLMVVSAIMLVLLTAEG